jgi:hypothetical protein
MNNSVTSRDNLYKIHTLSNQIIANEIKIGKYVASIKWENLDGLFYLRIKLTWNQEITTLEIFEQIGLFASKVGLVSQVNINAHSAVIETAVAIIKSNEGLETIDLLGRAIENIIDILKHCLMAESDGLDNPHSQKSKDLAEQRKYVYFTDAEWNECKNLKKDLKTAVENALNNLK